MISFSKEHLQPLEIWHGRVGDRYLYELQGESLSAALESFLRDVHDGRAETRRDVDTSDLKSATGFAKLVIRGGNSKLAHHLAGRGDFPFEIELQSEPGPFSAWEGARFVFNERGWKSGLAIDVGQSALKVMHERARSVHPRDLAWLPYASAISDVIEQRRRFKKWIEHSVAQEELNHRLKFDGLCLALPVKLKGLAAERCTYAGLSGDMQEFFSGLDLPPTVLLNDAVLTALGNQCPGRKTLVVTIGFALGAAIWHA